MGYSAAATPDRITQPVDATRTRTVAGNVHHLAQPRYDQGAADPRTPMDYMVFLVKPTASQQAELNQLLSDQQNPASPQFHRWLTPEAFGGRFGLSEGDLAKVAGWLKSEGFAIDHQARGRNWIAFSGAAGQTARAFHTSIRRYVADGKTSFANASEPSVPEALADVAGGFLGLNNFPMQPAVRLAQPGYNLGSFHFLAPADFATIYDLAPLYLAGLDGTGQSIAVVGESDVQSTDLSAFRTRYGLPANAPRLVLYSGVDPGYNGAEVEGALDLEWAGAIAPKAAIYYVYGASAFTAMAVAIDLDIAPVITASYGLCEVNFAPAGYEPLAQQANAQGITLLAAAGDAGAAGCDQQAFEPLATRGRAVQFPAAMPEVTGIGGSQFVEGTGSYWAAGNSSTFGSALSYIPEAAWNESNSSGLGASGGGASRLYSKPGWQTGPGVPNDSARDVPDLAFSAASHDAYQIFYGGGNASVAGTSCGTPSMAGIVALLNQYQINKGNQTLPGLGNINPQLYRLAQSAPSAFHDIVSGNSIVPCAQGSPDCATGSLGYPAAPGYDMATGLGSIDANNLFTQWNTAANGVTLKLSGSAAKGTLNDTIQVTATVAATAGGGVPTGTVNFSILGNIGVGSVTLSATGGKQTATVTLPLYEFGGAGTFFLAAQYSGDASFSGGGGTIPIQVTLPSGAAAIVVSGPNTVWPNLDLDAQSIAWITAIDLRETAGVAAMVTGFTIDGQAQSLSQYFPSPDILPGGALSVSVVMRNLSTPLTHTFGFTGVDEAGIAWSRQIAVNYLSVPSENQYSFTAAPLTVTQNAANPACQFPLFLSIDDSGGYLNVFTGLWAGTVDMSSQFVPIFGTTRLQAWGSIQGTLCLNGITPPASEYVYPIRSDGFAQEVLVNFAKAPANPIAISAVPAAISLTAPSVSQAAQATLSLGIGDKSQQWTAAVYPNNRTAGWLSLSQLSGTGPAQIALTASGFGYEPGAYRALIVIQSANAVPQYITVPVMFVLGAASGISIAGVADPASGQTIGAAGMLLSVFGAGLAGPAQNVAASPLPFSAGSVTATVNNLAAPLLYVSPNQVNIQIPYEVGAGPAVLGISNNGQVAGFQFQVAPSAPGIYTDGNGNLAGNVSVQAGGIATLYLNGAGDVTPTLLTANFAPASPPVAPVMPLSVAVDGVPALLQFAGLAPGNIGTTQVNFYVPASLSGAQPVVVTVGGVSSPPVNVTVKK